MPKQDPEISALQEELADAQAQIEALQSATADAEARAATARAELASLRAELAEAHTAHDSAQAELVEASSQIDSLRGELAEVHSRLRDAAIRYRDARLAAAPHIPADLVPGETVEEIEQQLEAAQKVVAQLREKLEADARREESRPARIPIGAPARRAPDLSALSPTEKIKLGLQQLGEREGR